MNINISRNKRTNALGISISISKRNNYFFLALAVPKFIRELGRVSKF